VRGKNVNARVFPRLTICKKVRRDVSFPAILIKKLVTHGSIMSHLIKDGVNVQELDAYEGRSSTLLCK